MHPHGEAGPGTSAGRRAGSQCCITTEGGAEHIEALAQRYLGAPYPWYGGRDQVRVILTIRADKVRGMGQLTGQ